MTLAELKLYLWEEHLQQGTVKSWLKRSFEAASGGDKPRPAPGTPDTSAQANKDADSSGISTTSFQHELVGAAEADEDKPEPNPHALSIPICQLFNINEPSWIEAYEKLGCKDFRMNWSFMSY